VGKQQFLDVLGKYPAEGATLFQRVAEMLGNRLVHLYPSIAWFWNLKQRLGKLVKRGACADLVVFAMGEVQLAEILWVDRRDIGFADDQPLVAF
jgi:hypothetical protein